ncbi:MAG: hypothetical protein CBC71_06415 [Rhodobacteraceae bacterium TMED111]|nr:hypothetical protein [Marinovum sp.]OUV41042.1 MAG: hypothetical protein CBC71_06415 [Rhodobacteraceae bacterium TMED111]|tara:strand:- start:4391 stop:4873 length:483 start_codon:yes stop_codon:yes gene_type:complete
MSEDARFEDGEDKALNIGAFDKSDLQIVSSLIQDSILPANEIKWLSTSNKLALLINRFRWEDKNLASSKDREVERVQSLLMISHVKSISSSGFSPKQRDQILSILSTSFNGDDGGSGNILFVFSGNAGIRVEVDALEINLRDVTMPYISPSGRSPEHNIE